jgi:hypothetical protein
MCSIYSPTTFLSSGQFWNKQKIIHIYSVFIVQAYQPFQYVVPLGGIFLEKCRSSFARSSGGKMNVQSAYALNTRYKRDHSEILEVGERIILKYILKQ